MEFILNKLLFISKLNNLNENLMKCESVVTKNKLEHNIKQINNNSVKMFEINSNNEDKQRQCYKQLKCFWPKCRYSCNRHSELNQHILVHSNKKNIICDECNKQFHHNSRLLKHKRYVHSNDRPFVCNQINCNKRFKTKAHLIQHNLTHSSVKSFGCNKCDKRFKTFSDLNIHKKFVHTNIQPFVCPQSDCNKRFKRRYNLNQHKRIHCSEKPFECEECNKKFKSQSYLMSHKLIHSNVKQFICDVNDCIKRFKQRSGLYDHKIRFHSGIKRHKCHHNNCN